MGPGGAGLEGLDHQMVGGGRNGGERGDMARSALLPEGGRPQACASPLIISATTS